MHTACQWQTFFAVPPCLVDVMISPMVPLANLGFARGNICLVIGDTSWDLPTKENIVSRPCGRCRSCPSVEIDEMELPTVHFSPFSVGGWSVTNGLLLGICALDFLSNDPYRRQHTWPNCR